MVSVHSCLQPYNYFYVKKQSKKKWPDAIVSLAGLSPC